MLLKIKHPTQNQFYITSFQSYKLYLVLTNAFRKGYDPLKYQWKINVKEQTFLKRNDKKIFDKLSKDYDLHEQQKIFMVNLLANPDSWIGDLISQDQIIFYRKYISRFNDLSILFKEDIQNLILLCKQRDRPFKSLFQKEFDFPIFKLLQKDSISYESFILLDSYFNFISELDNQKDFIWDSFSIRIKAYRNLFEINREEVIKILKEQLSLWKD